MGAFRFGPGADDRRRSLSATGDVHTALSDEVVRMVAAGGNRGVVVASLTGNGTYAGRPIALMARRLLTDYGYGRIDGAALGRGLSDLDLAPAPVVRDEDDFSTCFLADLLRDRPEAVAVAETTTSARATGTAPWDPVGDFLADLMDDVEPEGEDGAMSMVWDLGDGPDAEESD